VNAGKRIAASIATMAITTSNSINVNAHIDLRHFIFHLLILLNYAPANRNRRHYIQSFIKINIDVQKACHIGKISGKKGIMKK
jgi:accessory gene regulator protein AgrB